MPRTIAVCENHCDADYSVNCNGQEYFADGFGNCIGKSLHANVPKDTLEAGIWKCSACGASPYFVDCCEVFIDEGQAKGLLLVPRILDGYVYWMDSGFEGSPFVSIPLYTNADGVRTFSVQGKTFFFAEEEALSSYDHVVKLPINDLPVNLFIKVPLIECKHQLSLFGECILQAS